MPVILRFNTVQSTVPVYEREREKERENERKRELDHVVILFAYYLIHAALFVLIHKRQWERERERGGPCCDTVCWLLLCCICVST